MSGQSKIYVDCRCFERVIITDILIKPSMNNERMKMWEGSTRPSEVKLVFRDSAVSPDCGFRRLTLSLLTDRSSNMMRGAIQHIPQRRASSKLQV